MNQDWQRQRERAGVLDLDAVNSGGFSLEVHCKGCGRTIVIDPLPLLRLAVLRRWDRHLMVLGKHMRCKLCGTSFPSLKPVDAVPDSQDVGITNEVQFNELKKRLRR